MPDVRPWSPAEIEEMIPAELTALDDLVLEFRTLTEDASAKNRDAKIARAQATLIVKGSNKEEREARATLHCPNREDPASRVADFEYAAELAAGVVRAHQSAIRARTTKLEMLRTLLVSARDVTK